MHVLINEMLHVEDRDGLFLNYKLLCLRIRINESIFGVLVVRAADEGSSGHEQFHAMFTRNLTHLMNRTIARLDRLRDGDFHRFHFN